MWFLKFQPIRKHNRPGSYVQYPNETKIIYNVDVERKWPIATICLHTCSKSR